MLARIPTLAYTSLETVLARRDQLLGAQASACRSGGELLH
jgi:hypothetical protein